MARCCSCNGIGAKCVRCVCGKNGRSCISCLPSRSGKCQNMLNSGQEVALTSSLSVSVLAAESSTVLAAESSIVSQRSTATPVVSASSDSEVEGGQLCDRSIIPCDGNNSDVFGVHSDPDQDSEAGHDSTSTHPTDVIMMEAYGAPFVHSGGIDTADASYQRWNTVVHMQGKIYDLPGGAVGRKYVDLLSQEVSHVSVGNYPADRLIVFSAVMLQKDRMVKKSADVRRVLERRMSMWKKEEFDQLLQEAVRCDRSLRNTHRRDLNNKHLIRVFMRLMLQGKVRAAVRWLSERARGVLHPTDMVDMKNSSGNKSSVLDILRQKHPDPVIPPKSALISCTELPKQEDVEITGGHILRVARLIQGGAGPGGCDASHWQDTLLRYGAHSERLRESVASLCWRLANSIVPWSEIRALVASRLIALDKCPGVRPIGVGETLRRVMGKAMSLATRMDAEEVAGVTQLCAGTRAGIEGAIHALNDLFEVNKANGWGVLLMDASNAFNCLNRTAALWNVRVLWPRCSRFLFNTYRGWATLVVHGSASVLYSKGGSHSRRPSFYVSICNWLSTSDLIFKPA